METLAKAMSLLKMQIVCFFKNIYLAIETISKII
jgi:hypothetical protein